MGLVLGQKAPDFSLYDHAKNKVNLHDFEGENVVLLFFPLAFTSVCTKELCMVRDQIALFNEANAVVFGISVDSLYVLNKYRAEQNLNFSLLSDFNKTASRSYDVLYPQFTSFEMEGVSKRAVFIICKDQKLRYMEVCDKPADLPDFSAIKLVLVQLG